jgi:hypothetical protein
LAEGFGPETLAVTVFGFAVETDVAAAGHFFSECAKIGAEFVVPDDS